MPLLSVKTPENKFTPSEKVPKYVISLSPMAGSAKEVKLPTGATSPLFTIVVKAPPLPAKIPLPPAYSPRNTAVLPLIAGSLNLVKVAAGAGSPVFAIVVVGPPLAVKIPWPPFMP
jgi:hypothetical protein